MTTSKVDAKIPDQSMLSLLTALEEGEAATQRSLAQRIGVALGLVNGLLKRAAHKGLVKITEAPAKRYAYYVTPKGFNEKSRLVAEYLSTSLDFFRRAREEFVGLYHEASGRGHTRLVLFGAGELAEIAIMSAQECDVEVIGVIHVGSNEISLSGVPVHAGLEALSSQDYDAIVITCTNAPQDTYAFLSDTIADEKIYAAPLLHINRQTMTEDVP